jgi:hypothetical protein
VPLLAVRYMPFTDMPEHVAAIATLSRLIGDPHAAGPYEVSFGSSQYLLYHLVGALLALAVRDAVLANQILLAVVAVAWCVSLRALLRALGRDERLAIFGAMPLYGRPLMVGFLPYLASVPIALFALATFARARAKPTPGRAVALGALSVALFFTHVSTYVLFVATAIAWSALEPRRALLRSLVRLVPLAPSAALAALWWRTRALGGGRPPVIASMGVVRSLEAIPVWTFDIWRSHADEACACAWWLGFGVVLFVGLRARTPRRAALVVLAPLACALLAYFATPFEVGMAWFLNVRLAPLVLVFAALALPLRPTRASRAALALVAVATLALEIDTLAEGRRLARERLGDFDALLARIEPGSRVVTLNFEATSRRAVFWPYTFAGSYARARGASVAEWSFTGLPHWSLRYRAGEAPPKRRPFWVFAPCAYRYEEDGAYYDYVLVQGDRDPFGAGEPGPPFVRVATSGAFTLWGKAQGPPAHEPGDRGPCESPPVASR